MPSIESCNIHVQEIKYINVDGSVLETKNVLFIELIKIYLQKRVQMNLKIRQKVH